MEWSFRSAEELVAALRAGEVTSVEVTDEAIARVERDDEVIFLHKIAPGNADKSYGIHVARLAGVPDAVLKRATAVLATLEKQHELPTPQRESVTAKGNVVLPPEAAPRRKHKLKPQITGPTLFGNADAEAG